MERIRKICGVNVWKNALDGWSTGGLKDGGICLTVRKDRKTSLVQWKNYRVSKVSLSMVRDFYGAMNANLNYEVGYFITTGIFTLDAKQFARINKSNWLMEQNWWIMWIWLPRRQHLREREQRSEQHPQIFLFVLNAVLIWSREQLRRVIWLVNSFGDVLPIPNVMALRVLVLKMTAGGGLILHPISQMPFRAT